MEDTKEGVKEEAGTEQEYINIKVMSQDNQEVHFKIKRKTPMRKLISAYCQKQGLEQTSVRFLFDGTPIAPESTPDQLDMQDNDAVEVMHQQVGVC